MSRVGFHHRWGRVMTPPAENLLHGPQALRRECMQHAKRSSTRANIEKIKQEIAAVDADSQKMTATIDVRLYTAAFSPTEPDNTDDSGMCQVRSSADAHLQD